MTINVNHLFVSGKADGSDPTKIQPSNWNANHVLVNYYATAMSNFNTTTGTLPSASISSNTLTITAPTDRVYAVTCAGHSTVQLNVNGKGWVNFGVMRNGDTIQLRYTPATSPVTTILTLYIDGQAVTWSDTTVNLPTPPTGYTGWWKADANVYKDAGTTLCVNNDTIQQWNTQVSTDHFVQATSGNRPTFLTNQQNSLPGVKLMGATSGQFMGTGNSSFQDTSATLVSVGKFVNTGGNPRCFGYGVTRSMFSNGTWEFYNDAITSTADSGVSSTTTAIIVWRVSTGVAEILRINGVTLGVSLKANNNPGSQGLGIGAHSNDGTERGDCMLHELIHYPYILNSTDSGLAETYLNAKWNVY